MNMKQIYEDAMVAAGGDAGGMVSAPVGMTDTGVLGHCDHQHDGYMGDGCFHIPANAIGSSCMKRHEIPSKKKKNHKNPYVKNMTMITDAELDRSTISAIHRCQMQDIIRYIQTTFDTPIKTIIAIAYFPVTKTFFIKFKSGFMRTNYVNADFINGHFIETDDLDVYDSNSIRVKYSEILHMNGNNSDNVGSDDMNLWIVWRR